MTTITLPRAVVEQALEAMRCAVPTGKITLYEWDKAMAALRAALAEPVEPTPTFHVEPLKWGCRVCRIGADGNAYGFVCSRYDCPTKATCGGTV